MPCYKPMNVWRGATNENGKRPIIFSPPKLQGATALQGQTIPCGQCIGCRLEYARQWAIRCMHEKKMHEQSTFITLTYDDEHLPSYGSLNIEDFQKFMKRLRKNQSQKKIRFFQCGEYGENFQRPHHHAIIFGHDFDQNESDNQVKSSAELKELWPYGFNTVGQVTFESASYVARYVTKKITGRAKENHYQGRKPEYCTMSRRPGIGKPFYDKFKDEIHRADSVIMRGLEMKPPKYYDKQLELDNPDLHAIIKAGRIAQAQKKLPDLEGLKVLDKADKIDYHYSRLATVESVKTKTQKLFDKRSLENG